MDGELLGRGIALGRTETAEGDAVDACGAPLGRVAGIPLGGVSERDITLGSIGVPLSGVSLRDEGGGGRVDGVPAAGVTERGAILGGAVLGRASVVGGAVLGRRPAGRGTVLDRDSVTARGAALGRDFTDAGGTAMGRDSGVDCNGAAVGASAVAVRCGSGSGLLGAATASLSSELPHSSSMSSVVGANDLNDGGAEVLVCLVSGAVGRVAGGAAIASVVTGAPGVAAAGGLSAVPARLLALGFLVFLLIALRRLVLTQNGAGWPRPEASLILTVASNQPDNWVRRINAEGIG